MQRIVDRAEVQRLVAAGAQLVDVRDRADYEAAHIAGAVSLPLKELTADAMRALDRSRPIVVYCHDFQ